MGGSCGNIISSNPADVILFIFALLVLIICCWCIWAFFYAIFLFIFSKWDDNKVKSAWNSIRYMIIWIFLTVMLLFAGPTLLRLFNMPNSGIYSARNIFNKIGTVVSCFTEWVVFVVKNPDSGPLWNQGYYGWSYNESFEFDEL